MPSSDTSTKLPPIRGVPRASELGHLNPREGKNFLKNNRLEAMEQVKKKVNARSSYDHSSNKNVGKVPSYLNKFKD
jgi:hypothetical protein